MWRAQEVAKETTRDAVKLAQEVQNFARERVHRTLEDAEMAIAISREEIEGVRTAGDTPRHKILTEEMA